MLNHAHRIAAGAAMLLVSGFSAAHDGDLDRGFGTDGLTIIDFGSTATAYGLAVDPNGRIVLGGVVDGGVATGIDFAVARLTPDGQPDTSFSFDGKTTIAVGEGNAYDNNFNTIAQSDGKIVVIGEGADTADPLDDADFKLVRLNTDGTLDATFNGDGKAYVNFDLGGDNGDRALDGVQLANGKLIVVGSAEVAGQGTDFAVARLNADGTRDTSFDGDGRVTFHFDLDPVNLDETASSVAIDANGNILVAGIAETAAANSYDWAIARLTPNGALDANFGGDGRVTISFDIGGSFDDEALELIVAPDGSIFVTGVATDSGYDFAAVKLLPDGTPDASFGTNGKVTIPFDLGATNTDIPYGAALQPDGKLILVGYASLSDTDADVALVRLDTDGTLDPSFGFDGKKIIGVNVFGNAFDAAVRGRIQNGYLVFGGVATTATDVTSFLAGRVIIDTIFDNGFEPD
ncbi:MAG TPA: hypothetical protein VJ724_06815 [Tahibacter sp.]|nr:hypothetical protein [Tahibacter sp.]